MTTKIEWTDETSGNRIVDKSGYAIVYCPNHPRAKPNGYVFEHRLVMESHLKRYLDTSEHIHHVNGSRLDNRIENLELHSSSEHAKIHFKNRDRKIIEKSIRALNDYAKSRKIDRKSIDTLCACGCGMTVLSPDKKGRIHQYIQGHNQVGKHWKWSES